MGRGLAVLPNLRQSVNTYGSIDRLPLCGYTVRPVGVGATVLSESQRLKTPILTLILTLYAGFSPAYPMKGRDLSRPFV
jgi:hypothetical protein